MKKIAVVEDNPDNRFLVCTLLEELYEIQEYTDGEEALKGMTLDAPDLILLDISLPSMDGLELLSIIRENKALAALPVIALTAHAMGGDKERFLEAGFNGYLSKPIIDENELLSELAKHLA